MFVHLIDCKHMNDGVSDTVVSLCQLHERWQKHILDANFRCLAGLCEMCLCHLYAVVSFKYRNLNEATQNLKLNLIENENENALTQTETELSATACMNVRFDVSVNIHEPPNRSIIKLIIPNWVNIINKIVFNYVRYVSKELAGAALRNIQKTFLSDERGNVPTAVRRTHTQWNQNHVIRSHLHRTTGHIFVVVVVSDSRCRHRSACAFFATFACILWLISA